MGEINLDLHDLHDVEFVENKIKKYLKRRKFFQRRGCILANEEEKFLGVRNVKELAFGLNNVVYNLNIEFKLKNKIFDNRDFILRIYPDNNNIKKPSNEAKRIRQIQNLKIPKAKIYFFEKNLKHLGYRFLILEKLEGSPILESIADFSATETQEFLADLARYLGTLHSIRSKVYDSYYLDDKITRKMTYASYILNEVKLTLKNFSDLKLDSELSVDTRYLYKWCRGHNPLLNLEEYSLTHGDIRPSNIIVNKHKIKGLIDWEMSCYSDPAQDIGWSLYFFTLYENLKGSRGFFFSEYWKACQKYDVEARVYFYEVIVALKLYIYARWTEINQPEKYSRNRDFFERVKIATPKYIERLTHRD
ncbi:MAG: phosphotransferase [Promethearchaeota archaeon]